MLEIGGKKSKMTHQKMLTELKDAGYISNSQNPSITINFLKKDVRTKMTRQGKRQTEKPGGRSIAFRGVHYKDKNEVIYYERRSKNKKDDEDFTYYPSREMFHDSKKITNLEKIWFLAFCAGGLEGNAVHEAGVSGKLQLRIVNDEKEKIKKGQELVARKKIEDIVIVSEDSSDAKIAKMKNLAILLQIEAVEQRSVGVVVAELYEKVSAMTIDQINQAMSLLKDDKKVTMATLIADAIELGVLKEQGNSVAKKKEWAIYNIDNEKSVFIGGMPKTGNSRKILEENLNSDKELLNMLTREVDRFKERIA